MANYMQRIAQAPQRVYEIRIPQRGRMAYFRFSVNLAKEQQFKKACALGLHINLHDFGTILESRFEGQS